MTVIALGLFSTISVLVWQRKHNYVAAADHIVFFITLIIVIMP